MGESHLAIAFAGTAWLILVLGAGAGLAHRVPTDDIAGAFERVVTAALVQIPAAWVLVVFFLLLGEFGSLFELNQVVLDISPYAHVPKLPGGELTVAPLVWLTVAAGALTAAGMLGVRRRDAQPA